MPLSAESQTPHRWCFQHLSPWLPAPATRTLPHGARALKIYGEYVPIKCQTEEVACLSAHADYVEIGDWLSRFEAAPRQVFLTHGEPLATDSQRCYLTERLGWNVTIPEMHDEVGLV